MNAQLKNDTPISARFSYVAWVLTRMFLGSKSNAASMMPTNSGATKILTMGRSLIFGMIVYCDSDLRASNFYPS